MLFLGVLFSVTLFLFFFWLFPLFFHGIPWQPTDMKRVRRMLEMSDLKPGEVLYDLGCGDGRILVCAAREYRAQAVGVELNPWLYLLAILRVFFSGHASRVRVIFGNLHTVPLYEADVVTIFLFSHVNELLQEKFRRELKEGARIVSYVWKLPSWVPAVFDSEYNLYLYVKGK
ncbi:MAG: class I SAM-dependent methyltransferase [Candidatus Atribacteria bacterium]|nr:class I SAM-dependent methyltransferase [Candidatus Atribacteria bacterium]